MNKRQLRIVYMGTPEFAVTPLKKLIEKGYSVVGVVTNPDKPAGRGQKIKESPVKIFARKHNLPILQPEKFRDPKFLEELRNLKADLQIVVAFKMLPEVVWAMPPQGNLQFACLSPARLQGSRPNKPCHY